MIRPRIIVTGATGKTGSVVVTELLKVLAQQMQSSQSVLGMRKPASILSICLVAALFSAAAWAQQSESARSLSAPSVDWNAVAGSIENDSPPWCISVNRFFLHIFESLHMIHHLLHCNKDCKMTLRAAFRTYLGGK